MGVRIVIGWIWVAGGSNRESPLGNWAGLV
ncbi:hypothetical protein PSHT_07068 [Puccinia striiformis]|uniref:Uncharacterized protein n=1 Tax=Puccinia striiformis TaxID=27350 RepID=A0A2S4W0Z0_9BASI|nr:hypothetical protein PSHT_07068 [Puccinia striiformis]